MSKNQIFACIVGAFAISIGSKLSTISFENPTETFLSITTIVIFTIAMLTCLYYTDKALEKISYRRKLEKFIRKRFKGIILVDEALANAKTFEEFRKIAHYFYMNFHCISSNAFKNNFLVIPDIWQYSYNGKKLYLLRRAYEVIKEGPKKKLEKEMRKIKTQEIIDKMIKEMGDLHFMVRKPKIGEFLPALEWQNYQQGYIRVQIHVTKDELKEIESSMSSIIFLEARRNPNPEARSFNVIQFKPAQKLEQAA